MLLTGVTPCVVITGSRGAYSNLTNCFLKAEESTAQLCTVFMMGSHRPYTYHHRSNIGPYWRRVLGQTDDDILI